MDWLHPSQINSTRTSGHRGDTNISSGVDPTQVLTVADLFEQARQAAIIGEYERKLVLYQRIFERSDATAFDKLRVEVYFADLKRRKGDPDGALRDLQPHHSRVLELPLVLRAELQQAIGQCYFMKREITDALNVQRALINDNEFSALPPDIQIYHLESGIAFKVEIKEFDSELASWISTLETCAVLEPAPTPAVSARIRCTISDIRGDMTRLTNDNPQLALEHYARSFDQAPAARNKLVAAAKFLSLLRAVNGASERRKELEEYFRDNLSEAQETDFAGYPQLREMRELLAS